MPVIKRREGELISVWCMKNDRCRREATFLPLLSTMFSMEDSAVSIVYAFKVFLTHHLYRAPLPTMKPCIIRTCRQKADWLVGSMPSNRLRGRGR